MTSSLHATAAALQRALRGDAWHGPGFAELLADVTAAEAAAYPVAGAHSIWELTLHAAAWLGEVHRRLLGATPALPAEGDWPPTGETTPARWDATRARLLAAGDALGAALRAFDAGRLEEVVGGDRDAPLGVGVTWDVMVRGAVEHTAYHAGQVAVLKRALRG